MADAPLLQLDGLSVTAANGAEPNPIDGLSLTIERGELHAIIGSAESGRSALAATLLGSSEYRVTAGSILLRGDDITTWATDVRARAGLFLAFGRPQGISGTTILGLLHRAMAANRGVEVDVSGLRHALIEWTERLAIEPSTLERDVNQGSSLAEKQRNEILQAAILEPDLLIVDDPDPSAGADVEARADDDAVEAMATTIRTVRGQRPTLGTLAITHCQRLLDHLEPDHVHSMVGGRIVASGGPELAVQLETEGYGS